MIKKRLFYLPAAAACTLSLLLTGCGNIGLAQEATFESAYENKEEEEPVDIYLSEAAVIIESVSEEEQTIDVYMTERNESRTYAYTGATTVQDKYGSPMSMVQLNPGDIADIKYNSELERIGSVALSADAWNHEGISKYNLDIGNGSASVGDEVYSMSGSVKVFSEGRPIEADQIIQQDVLTFRGKGSTILSIVVDQGHGYLDLENEQAVIGGWIEVGQTLISQIAPDMLFVVPEGNYTVRFSGAGIEEVREISIERNKETLLDLGDIEIPQPEKGLVTIVVTPAAAQVFIDENKVDTTYPVRIPVGLHQITAKASGYDTVSEYFEVNGENQTVSLELGEYKTVSGNSISKKDETKEAKITISTPVDAEVYQDNLYMGIAPVTYTKTSGSHTITLRRQGYITRSYNIDVPDDDKDVTYAFPDLDPENSDTVSGNSLNGNTVSGNTVSGNSVDAKSSKNNGENGETVSGNTVSGNSADED
ncbi:MAG: PEGA domain-containing protein [Lachnospiraceae bacterium]|nr:PEGA domain-containing protein [Lachnospiraceae bacterium]